MRVIVTCYYTLVLVSFQVLVASGSSLANKFKIDVPELVHRPSSGDNRIELRYKLSSKITEKQIKVELKDYGCENILYNPPLKELEREEEQDDGVTWKLTLRVKPPSAYQNTLQSWYNLKTVLLSQQSLKKMNLEQIANKTKSLAYSLQDALFAPNNDNTGLACVRFMIHSMDWTSEHSLQVNFEESQLDAEFKDQVLEKVGLTPMEKKSLNVNLGGNGMKGQTDISDKESSTTTTTQDNIMEQTETTEGQPTKEDTGHDDTPKNEKSDTEQASEHIEREGTPDTAADATKEETTTTMSEEL